MPAAQVDGSFAVVVEHRQVVDAVDGHPDQIAHRQRGVAAGARRRRHRDIGVGDGVGGLVEFGQRGAHDHADRVPAMGPHSTGGDAGLQAELDAVVAALGGAALIGHLGDRALG